MGRTNVQHEQNDAVELFFACLLLFRPPTENPRAGRKEGIGSYFEEMVRGEVLLTSEPDEHG